MTWLLLAIVIFVFGGVIAWMVSRPSKRWAWIGPASSVVGCLVGLMGVISLMIARNPDQALNFIWQVPYGSFRVSADPLSMFFLIPLFIISALAAIYGHFYLSNYKGQQRLGAHWFFFNVFIAGMVLVLVARNGVLFLVAWEIMSLSSYFLVTFEHEKLKIQKAGWIYLIATHVGMAFLMVLFILMGQKTQSMDFATIMAAGQPGSSTGLLFGLALIGFGLKAGIVPLHVWLPEAHPAAPSHVSALMSGIMIKLGLYGVLRFIPFFGDVPHWYGYCLICIGLITGISGVLFAMVQNDLKRLLAYSSVENMGIILLGLGMGFLGISFDIPVLAVLGFGGGLLHIINHAVFKSLLFLSAGAVIQSSGTNTIELLGGLYKKMRWTGSAFLVGTIAICGLPPLNGFISEFLIYLGALKGSFLESPLMMAILLLLIAGLALIGALACAGFTKVFGMVFLGQPRSKEACQTRETQKGMRTILLGLAGACIVLGLAGPWVFKALCPVIVQISLLSGEVIQSESLKVMSTLWHVIGFMMIMLLLLIVIVFVRKRLLSNRVNAKSTTWDCGYSTPTARMQYTATSFIQPLRDLFGFFLRSEKAGTSVRGFFPGKSSLNIEIPDLFQKKVFIPLVKSLVWFFSKLRWLQHGRVQLYVLYIVVTLLVLLIWKLRG